MSNKKAVSKLPNKEELEKFCEQISVYRSLSPSFVRDMILKVPGKDMMNIYQRKRRKRVYLITEKITTALVPMF